MSNVKVSIQAFLQEIQNWGITLVRQSKKLKSIKPTVKNKFKLNSIQIVLTQIQSIQLQYKKIRNKYQHLLQNENQSPNQSILYNQKSISDQVLTQYSYFSKAFMDILEKVSLIQNQVDQDNVLICDEDQNFNQSNSNLFLKQNEKTYLNETFAYKVSKQQKHNQAKEHQVNNKNKSLFDQRKVEKQKQQNKLKQPMRHKAHSMISSQNQISLISVNNSRNRPSKSQLNKLQLSTNLNILQTDQDTNLWQIRNQLNQIRTMMKQMKNQIKYHEHEETTREINKLQSKNRKIASQLKSVKQQNRYIMDKLQQLKHQLFQEKKNQVDMINRFQRKSSGYGINYPDNYNIKDSRATHKDNYRSANRQKSSPFKSKTQQKPQNVSDWVKIRI